MLRITFISIVLFILSSAYAGKMDWHVSRELGKTTTWKHLSNRSLTASSQKIRSVSKLYKDSDKTKLIKELADQKRLALSYIGISQWTPDEYKWIHNNQLRISGTYLDHKGVKVSFIELHEYTPKMREIFVITRDDGETISSESLTQFVETAKKWQANK